MLMQKTELELIKIGENSKIFLEHPTVTASITQTDGCEHTPLKFEKISLREKCPNTEFFLDRILPHSDWIRRDTEYLSVFSQNAGKYGPEKTPYLETFHEVLVRKAILDTTLTTGNC